MNLSNSALLTDLYQLTMAQAYLEQQMDEPAVFEFFVRRLPPSRNFLLAAGLEQVLEFLSQLHITPEELAWLEGTGRFSPALLHISKRFGSPATSMLCRKVRSSLQMSRCCESWPPYPWLNWSRPGL